MRNLLNFVYKNYYFFSFLGLLFICSLLLVNNRSYQSTAILNSSHTLSGHIYGALANAKEYLSLKNENEKLAKENVLLRGMLKNSFDILPQTEPEFIRKDTLYRKKYIYTLAKVVNSSSNLQKNYITLNVGAKQGIEKDQAVINSLGVVAVVKDVSANFSTATSILNIDQKIISQVKKDGSYGPLAWDGKDYHYAYLTDIPTHVFLRKGDTIITSNLSDYFPEGITVGTVESYLRKQGDAFYTVKVKLSTDFKKLNYVYIVKNNYKEEKDSLEQAIKAGIK